jgi:hypothetical protein
VTTTVRFYTEDLNDTGLAPSIDMQITEGAGGGPGGDCTGFVASGGSIYSGTLANLGTTATSFATGLGTWTPPASTQTRTYQFTWTVDPAAPNTVMGTSAVIDFVWEAQSTV